MKEKQKAIIVDLDGTLCNIDHRLKYIDGSLGKKDWDKFYDECDKDEVNEWCAKIIKAFISQDKHYERPDCSGHIPMAFLFVTGRPEKIRDKTVDWIISNLRCESFELLMRRDGDFRKDSVIKQEIYENGLKERYDVLFCLEDRKQVVEMWRSLGLVCLQCAKGDF